jgi:hypothetical protein
MITPALIFCAWLLILATTASYQCPEECWCDAAGFTVSCFSIAVNTTPATFPKYVRILILLSYNLKFLRKDKFLHSKLTQLDYLAIQSCGIESVETGAFNGLKMLIELSLNYNKISEIERGTFENLTTLERLYLERNRITNLEPDTFLGLRNLRIIELDYNNIEYLHPDMFINAYHLESLTLSENPLQIPTDKHFISSPSLRHLDLSHCNISSISVETFSKVRDLNKLNLYFNDLKNLDVNILKNLPQLSEFLIYLNPLSCDCQLQQVWRWCQNHSITTGDRYKGPECDSPSEVHGMWWGTLQYSQCFDDRITYHEGYKTLSYRYIHLDEFDQSHERHQSEDFMLYIDPKVQAVLFTFGTTGNIIVLVIIVCNKDMWTVPNMYIINLVISDLIVLVVNVPVYQAYKDYFTLSFPEHSVECMFIKFLYRFSVGLSTYLVALLSYQRYKVTVTPLQVHVHSPVTWRITAATICGVWIVAAIFALPSTFTVYKTKNISCNVYSYEIYYKKVVLLDLCIFCILPLCAIVFFYVMTARHLVKSAHTISEEIHPLATRRKNTARIVLGLSIVFVISYVPYHIIWVYLILDDYNARMKLRYPYFISTWLILLNPCLDPVALFCCSLAFRTKFKRCLMCFRRRRVVTTTLQLAEFRRT